MPYINDGQKPTTSRTLSAEEEEVLHKEITSQKNKVKTQVTDNLKLIDAEDAGGKDSIDCTLVLTEGDSAMALVASGLEVLGRRKFGVLALQGSSIPNARRTPEQQVKSNVQITSIVNTVGLQYKKEYKTVDDLKTLRYGRLMLMTDQDYDGTMLKGRLITFIHYFWPSLLKHKFLSAFLMPTIKVSNDESKHFFHSSAEFDKWKEANPDSDSWTVRRYQSLGSFTSNEGKLFFQDVERHRVAFCYNGTKDDRAIEVAFGKGNTKELQRLIVASMEKESNDVQLSLQEEYLAESGGKSITIENFMTHHVAVSCVAQNKRAIPSIIDGFKLPQRKVFCVALKNANTEVKVNYLASLVVEKCAHYNSDEALCRVIINMAQNYTGSNNINLLMPIGQFGNRLTGGKNTATAHYLSTKLSPLTPAIFSPKDDPLLSYLTVDGKLVEPEHYYPILPTVLVNGCNNVGVGWNTFVPNHDPRVLAENVKRRLKGQELLSLRPFYKGFKGTFTQLDPQQFIISGEVVKLSQNTLAITEIPLVLWTRQYLVTVLQPMLSPADGQTEPLLTGVQNLCTADSVHFEVEMKEEHLRHLVDTECFHQKFKLQALFKTMNMVLFDAEGHLKHYESPQEIFDDFFDVRLQMYGERKRYYEGLLEAEVLRLNNQLRFIKELNAGVIKARKVSEAELTEQLIERGYESDPVKKWKAQFVVQKSKTDISREEDENDGGEEDAAEGQPEQGDDLYFVEKIVNKRTNPVTGIVEYLVHWEGYSAKDNTWEPVANFDSSEVKIKEFEEYDAHYLNCPQMRGFLAEEEEELREERRAKQAELRTLQQTTPEQLWLADIDIFLAALDEEEKKEQKEAENSTAASDSAPLDGGERLPPPHGLTCICGMTFSTFRLLKMHKVNVHPVSKQLSYLCDICDSSFGNSHFLRKHKKEAHTEKEFQCPFCSAWFTNNSLRKHLQKTDCIGNALKYAHSTTRPHKCSVCGKGYTGRNELAHHVRLNHTEKKFPCDNCGMKFATKFNLKKHMNRKNKCKPVSDALVASTSNKLQAKRSVSESESDSNENNFISPAKKSKTENDDDSEDDCSTGESDHAEEDDDIFA